MSKKSKMEKDVDINAAGEEEVVEETAKESGAEQAEAVVENKEASKEEEELNTRYLRLAADFQNFKRRVEKEKSDIYACANEKIVVDLLDVIDNFDRALEHSSTGGESFADGMKMIFKQLKGVLEKNGVEEILSLGEEFDPNFHHAVLTDASDQYESGKVTAVLQKGYLLNKRVIRPAMVKVAE